VIARKGRPPVSEAGLARADETRRACSHYSRKSIYKIVSKISDDNTDDEYNQELEQFAHLPSVSDKCDHAFEHFACDLRENARQRLRRKRAKFGGITA